MFKRIRVMLQLKTPLYLSEVPEFISLIPGTRSRDVAEATTGKYKDLTARFLEFLGHDPLVETITRETFAEFHDWLGNRGTRAVTTNGYRRRLRAIWSRLRKRGVNVCDDSGIFREQLEPAQTSKATASNHLIQILQIANIRDAAIVLYLKSAGFRRQTVVRLTIDNTFIWPGGDSGVLRIASKIPQEKTSPPRLIIGDEAAALAVQLWISVREYQASPWLFYDMNTGEQLTINSVSAIFGNLRRRASIPAWTHATAHGLRHRFCQEQLTQHDAKIVAQWMGISVDTMLKVYAHRDGERLISERLGDADYPVELLNGHVAAIV